MDGVGKPVPEGCDGEGWGWNLSLVRQSEQGGDVSKRAPQVSRKSELPGCWKPAAGGTVNTAAPAFARGW